MLQNLIKQNPLIEKYLNLSNGKNTTKQEKQKSFNLRKFSLLFSKEIESPRERERVFTLGFGFSEGDVGVVTNTRFSFFQMRAIGQGFWGFQNQRKMRQRGFVMRGKDQGFSVFLDETKIKKVRVFQFSKMRGKQGRLGFSFNVQCPWEMKQIYSFCFVCFSVLVGRRVGDSFFFSIFFSCLFRCGN